MWFNRAALKAEAKACMRQSKANPYVTALVYIAVCFIISELSSRILPEPAVYYVIDYGNYNVHVEVNTGFLWQFYERPFAALIDFLLQIADMMLDAGMVIFALNVAKRAASSIGNLFDGFAHFLRIILLYIVEGIFIFLWALLFIIPGFVAAYRYRLAVYLLLDHSDMGVMDCIRESKRLMRGRKLELFVLDLSFLGWLLLTAIPIAGLAVSVYVTPYIETTRAGFYLAVTGMDSRHDPGGHYGHEYERRYRPRDDDYREPWER